jgi:betaine-aldehyde dehydrogenase
LLFYLAVHAANITNQVEMANESRYGLAHAVMSADLNRVDRVASRLNAGVVYLNCNQVGFVNTPFGGTKQSGFGREWGVAGLEEYIQHKTVTAAVPPKYSWNWYA